MYHTDKKQIFLVIFILVSSLCYAEDFLSKSCKFSFQGGKIVTCTGLYLNIKILMNNEEGAYLRIKSPFDMNILNPDNLEYGANRRSLRLKYNGSPQIIKLYRGNKSTYQYEKKSTNGRDYYTRLTIDFDQKDGKGIANSFVFEIKYEMETDNKGKKVPILQKFIYQDKYYKTTYFRAERLCPATKRMEPCVVLSRINKNVPESEKLRMPVIETCYFSIDNGRFINSYVYERLNKNFKFSTSRCLQKIGSKYKIVEYKENGSTINFEYFDDKVNDGKYYGKIKNIIYPDKSEKHYTYFPDGIIKSVTKTKPN